jgi:kinesin family protein C1
MFGPNNGDNIGDAVSHTQTFFMKPTFASIPNPRSPKIAESLLPMITPSKVKRVEELASSVKPSAKIEAIGNLFSAVENGNSIKKLKEIEQGLLSAASPNVVQGSAASLMRTSLLHTTPPEDLKPGQVKHSVDRLTREINALQDTIEKLKERELSAKPHQEIVTSKEFQEQTAKFFTNGFRAKLLTNAEQKNVSKDKHSKEGLDSSPAPIDPLKRFSVHADMLPSPPTPNVSNKSNDLEKSAILKKQQETERRLKELTEQLEMVEKKLVEESAVKRQLQDDLEEKNKCLDNIKQKYEDEISDILQNTQNLRNQMRVTEESKHRHAQSNAEFAEQLKKENEKLKLLQLELEKSEAQRMRNLAQLQELRGNLRVFCRLKPINLSEERSITFTDKEHKELLLSAEPSKKSKPVPFIFDYIFSESTTQSEVFREVEPFVQSTLDGKQTSIFAYGPTGSGKTHTLEGDNHNSKEAVSNMSGVLPRSLALILQKVEVANVVAGENDQLEVYLSCLEIYNEKLGDLLSNDREKEIEITVNKGKIFLPGVVKKKITSMREALDTIRISSERRQTEATAYNSRSSRSHSIYRISISKRGANGEQLGLLNIIDMAGSEKNSLDTQDTDSKKALSTINSEKLKKIQKEANYINKSLTTLGRIVRLIKHQRTMGIKDLCIPYRESKLTRMLQDCIGGEAQTLLIVNINPSAKCVGQTKETLNFASVACV